MCVTSINNQKLKYWQKNSWKIVEVKNMTRLWTKKQLLSCIICKDIVVGICIRNEDKKISEKKNKRESKEVNINKKEVSVAGHTVMKKNMFLAWKKIKSRISLFSRQSLVKNYKLWSKIKVCFFVEYNSLALF